LSLFGVFDTVQYERDMIHAF